MECIIKKTRNAEQYNLPTLNRTCSVKELKCANKFKENYVGMVKESLSIKSKNSLLESNFHMNN